MKKIIVKSVPETCNMVAKLNEDLSYECYKRVSIEEFEYLNTMDYRTFSIFLSIASQRSGNIRGLVHIVGKITLSQLRENAGLSIRSAALKAGVSPSTLKRWENDCRKADAYKVSALMRNVYGCPLELLHIGVAYEQAI